MHCNKHLTCRHGFYQHFLFFTNSGGVWKPGVRLWCRILNWSGFFWHTGTWKDWDMVMLKCRIQSSLYVFGCCCFVFFLQQFEPIHDDSFVILQDFKLQVSHWDLIEIVTMRSVVEHFGWYKLDLDQSSRSLDQNNNHYFSLSSFCFPTGQRTSSRLWHLVGPVGRMLRNRALLSLHSFAFSVLKNNKNNQK